MVLGCTDIEGHRIPLELPKLVPVLPILLVYSHFHVVQLNFVQSPVEQICLGCLPHIQQFCIVSFHVGLASRIVIEITHKKKAISIL